MYTHIAFPVSLQSKAKQSKNEVKHIPLLQCIKGVRESSSFVAHACGCDARQANPKTPIWLYLPSLLMMTINPNLTRLPCSSLFRLRTPMLLVSCVVCRL
jgi:hypothetical protein